MFPFMLIEFFSLDTSFSYTGDTPKVEGVNVTFNISFGGGVGSAKCGIIARNKVQQEVDCE